MMKKSIRTLVFGFLTLFALNIVAACAAPLPSPLTLSPSDDGIVIATPFPVSALADQVIAPLILDVNQDGTLEPGLAESWSITNTADGQSMQFVFVLQQDWATQNNSSLRIEDIAAGLQQMDPQWWQDPDFFRTTSPAGVPGGNDCITPRIVTGSAQVPTVSVELPSISDSITLSVSIPYSSCGSSGETCEEAVMNAFAHYPIFNTDLLSFVSTTNTGNYVYSITGAGSMLELEYDEETGTMQDCLECSPKGPSGKKTCTPTPIPKKTP